MGLQDIDAELSGVGSIVDASKARVQKMQPQGLAAIDADLKSAPPVPAERGLVDRALTTAAAPFRAASKVADYVTSPLVDVARIAQYHEPLGQVLTNPSSRAPAPPGNPLITSLMRIIPSLAPSLPLAAGLSGAGEMLAQKTEAPDQPINNAQVAGAITVPPAVAGIGRVARALGRTVTRMSPTLFQGAHQNALNAAGELSNSLSAESNPSQLFQAAAKSDEPITATNLVQKLAQLRGEMPANPVSPELKTTNAHMANIDAAMRGGNQAAAPATRLAHFPDGSTFPVPVETGSAPRAAAPSDPYLSLKDLLGLRRDVGLSIGRGTTGETSALYGAMLRDLEGAAAAGGPGASMAQAALEAHKRNLGASKIADLVQQSTTTDSIGTAATPKLNISRLKNLVDKNSEDLTKWVGPDGMAQINQFIYDNRTLPPAHAASFANKLVSTIAGGIGLGLGGPAGLGAALVPEIGANAFAVGKNPTLLNQILGAAGQSGRAAIPGQRRQ